jgi:isoleucyl-tRNA synthetase
VDSKGLFTAEAGKFAGKNIFDADPLIIQELRNTFSLLHSEAFTHAYPHCWRCKQPVIFRATEQWFVLVDENDLRGRLLKEIENVEWIPDWGQTRITNMVQERPDWCISRQKSWGLPIPAFYCKSCGEVHLEAHTVRHVAKAFREKGSTSWFELPAADFLPEGAKCGKCGGADFDKETDIFDVWFESGSSHRAVCREEEELTWPVDLYLEGTDQHRGWFQLSLIVAAAADNAAPYRANFISVEDALAEFGAEITRLWVSSVNFRDDINVSRDLIGRLSDAYRRIRNTFRYILGNLHDFDPAKDAVADEALLEIDRWALAETARLVEAVTRAYEGYQFHRVYHGAQLLRGGDVEFLPRYPQGPPLLRRADVAREARGPDGAVQGAQGTRQTRGPDPRAYIRRGLGDDTGRERGGERPCGVVGGGRGAIRGRQTRRAVGKDDRGARRGAQSARGPSRRQDDRRVARSER